MLIKRLIKCYFPVLRTLEQAIRFSLFSLNGQGWNGGKFSTVVHLKANKPYLPEASQVSERPNSLPCLRRLQYERQSKPNCPKENR